MCTDVIHRVRRSYRAQGGSWSGWGTFYAELFVDDAIFVESEMGSMMAETVGFWEYSCRGLFGMDSTNKEKSRLMGRGERLGWYWGLE